MRKTWETPKLIVLVRNRPEEAVLSNCKGNSGLMAGVTNPAYNDGSCTQSPAMANTPVCANCSTLGAS